MTVVEPAFDVLDCASSRLKGRDAVFNSLVVDARDRRSIIQTGTAGAQSRRSLSELEFRPISSALSVTVKIGRPLSGPPRAVEVFLVFKEAWNNVLRHAECTKCSTALALDFGWVSLEVEDDGKGFDTATRARGLRILKKRFPGESCRSSSRYTQTTSESSTRCAPGPPDT